MSREVLDNVTTQRPCLAGPDVGADQLNNHFGRSRAVKFIRDEMLDGIVVQLAAGMDRASVALRGAQVLSWLPTVTTDDVLWLSPQRNRSTGKPIRGGSFVCEPRCSAHHGDDEGQSSGVNHHAEWCVASTGVSKEATCISLQLTQAMKAQMGWPEDAHVAFDVRLSHNLEMTLTVVNTGPGVMRINEALRTYLRIGDIATARIQGLENRSFVDHVTQNCDDGLESHSIAFDGEIDRVYHNSPDALKVEDPKLGRVLRLRSEGSHSTAIWNPWSDKAEHLGDFGPNGFREMVCVEMANAGSRAILLKPGVVHRMTATVSVQTLNRKKR